MKIINKINYEQFAIDYLEGNLSGDLLVEMNEFLVANSDINEELEEMKLYYLEADEQIIFEGKEALIQPISEKKRFFISPFFLMTGIIAVFVLTLGLFLFPSNKQEANITKTTLENTNNNPLVIDNKEIKEEIEEKIENPTVVIDDKKDIVVKNIKKNEVAKQTKKNVIIPNKSKSDQQLIQNTKNVIIKEVPNIKTQIPSNTNSIIKFIEPILPSKKEESEPIAQEAIPDINNHSNPENSNHLKPIRDNIDIEPLQLASLDMNSNDITLENTLTVVEKPLEEKSRLRRMGLLPENKINFKSMKEALTPEFFASKN